MIEPASSFTVSLQDGEIVLSFPFQPIWVAAIKRMRFRSFDPETRCWHVPAWLAPDLAERLERAEAPEEAITALRAIARETLAETAAMNARMLEAYERVVPELASNYPTLFPHQVSGITFLMRPREVRGALLADDMGLGKTRQAIIAAHEAHPQGEILVVCPAGLKLNWAREIRLALGPEAEVSVVGRAFWRARWTIVNYDLLRKHHAALVADAWSGLVLDEAHYIKNLRSQRSLLVLGGERKARRKTARSLPNGRIRGVAERAERLYLLTGTPITNRPLDLFALLRAIRHPLGDDQLAFALRYCAAFQTAFGWDMNGASHLDELHDRLSDVLLRRKKSAVLDLPPKLRTYMPVEVDLVAYRQVWLDYVARLSKRKRVPRKTLLAEVAKLRLAAAIAKIPAAIALAEAILEAGEKVIIFACHQVVIDAIVSHFGASCVKVTGAESASQRQQAVDDFQHDPGVRVFAGNLQAAGIGLSLTAATQVVFVDYSFVPAEHLQAEDRPYRIGQRNAVTVTYLSAVGTLDEEIERLLAQKLGVVAQAIDGEAPTLGESFLDDLLAVMRRGLAGD
ncbi:RNA polymerase-associated protein RapA [compost metagenome]